MAIEVRLPELGEGIEQAEVVRVLVAHGDTVAVDQPLVEIESDKATVEVPSPAAGTVTTVAVEAGGTLRIGALILSLETADAASTPDPPPEPVAPTASPAGTPPRSDGALDPTPAATAAPVPPSPPEPAGGGTTRRALAAPSVRKLAREIGVDIDAVRAGGRIGLEDVKAHARTAMRQLRAGATPGETPALPDFSRWGEIERRRMRSTRRTIARRMTQAWQTVPHVTQHDRADISEFEAVRKTVQTTSPELPLTVTAFAVAVVAAALKAFPQFNASVDVARDEIVYKRYINIGVAVDTERGLLVPVIRGPEGKSLGTLSTEIAALATRVRTQGAAPADLDGGTFTITNLGGLGGTAFTPIVNYPEVAILGLSRSAPAPVFINDRFEARPMLPLSLSYDHRLIDGADAVRFLRWIADRLEHPLLLEV